jgi:hypothetical protein
LLLNRKEVKIDSDAGADAIQTANLAEAQIIG